MRQDPQQELFSALMVELSRNGEGCKVYSAGLPPAGVAYPFIYLGDSQLVDELDTKSIVTGKVYQTIHVWHNQPENRGTLSALCLEIKDICRSISATSNFLWSIAEMSQQILPDNTTQEPLLHAVINAAYRFG